MRSWLTWSAVLLGTLALAVNAAAAAVYFYDASRAHPVARGVTIPGIGGGGPAVRPERRAERRPARALGPRRCERAGGAGGPVSPGNRRPARRARGRAAAAAPRPARTPHARDPHPRRPPAREHRPAASP